MDKREMIERALGSLLGVDFQCGEFMDINYDALVDQAIVIECEVDNTYGAPESPWTLIRGEFSMQGCHGTSGKALAIIIPLQEDD